MIKEAALAELMAGPWTVHKKHPQDEYSISSILCFYFLGFASVHLLLRSMALLRSCSISALRLDIVIKDRKCFVDLLTQLVIVVNPRAVSDQICRLIDNWRTYNDINSGLSISKSMPVILPASSGCNCWILG